MLTPVTKEVLQTYPMFENYIGYVFLLEHFYIYPLKINKQVKEQDSRDLEKIALIPGMLLRHADFLDGELKKLDAEHPRKAEALRLRYGFEPQHTVRTLSEVGKKMPSREVSYGRAQHLVQVGERILFLKYAEPDIFKMLERNEAERLPVILSNIVLRRRFGPEPWNLRLSRFHQILASNAPLGDRLHKHR